MDTIQHYNQTWWGRVQLLLRLDYQSYRRNLFIGLGLIVLFFNVVARMGVLFNYDISLSWFTGFSVYERFAFIWPVIFIASTLYINKRCQHSKPIVFSLLPANLWEKVVAMSLTVLMINLLAFVTTYVTLLIDWLLAPKFISLSLSFEMISFYFKNLRFSVGVSAFSLIFLLTIGIQLVQRKSYFKAFFLGCLYYFVVWVLAFRTVLYGVEGFMKNQVLYDKVMDFVNGNYEAMDMLSTLFVLFFVAVDVLLGYYLYTRLKKLEV